MAFAQSLFNYGVTDTLRGMNWKVFFLAGGMCYFLLSVVFHGSASHVISGETCSGAIWRKGKNADLNVLLDTGNTLSDPLTGRPVMIVWLGILRDIWRQEEWSILSRYAPEGAACCFEKLTVVAPGVFRLIPYRAVGVAEGVLLCFMAEKAVINNLEMGQILVAISPTNLSDGCGCNALWGGGFL